MHDVGSATVYVYWLRRHQNNDVTISNSDPVSSSNWRVDKACTNSDHLVLHYSINYINTGARPERLTAASWLR